MPTDAPLVPGEPAGLVDHHCHGVVETDLDRAAFEDLITESSVPAAPGCSFFDTQVGLAVRAHCARCLTCRRSRRRRTTWPGVPTSVPLR